MILVIILIRINCIGRLGAEQNLSQIVNTLIYETFLLDLGICRLRVILRYLNIGDQVRLLDCHVVLPAALSHLLGRGEGDFRSSDLPRLRLFALQA